MTQYIRRLLQCVWEIRNSTKSLSINIMLYVQLLGRNAYYILYWTTLVGKPVHDRLPIHNINGVNGELCTGFPAGVLSIGAPDNIYTV